MMDKKRIIKIKDDDDNYDNDDEIFIYFLYGARKVFRINYKLYDILPILIS